MNNLRHRFSPAGFTLIELLVVIGLIAVLSAGIGIALTTGGKGNALQSSQGIINSVLSGARGQAAIKQADAAVFVNIGSATDGFLREFYIATKNSGGDWVVTGEPTLLDKGIYVVPPSTLSGTVKFTGTWTGLQSTAYETNGTALNLYLSDDTTRVTDGGSNVDFRIIQIFNPRGVVNITSPDRSVLPATEMMKLVLSTAQRAASPVLDFDKPEEVRGVLITKYGVPIFVNEAASIKP
jgi:prepilin-type N-terminal cleavage/methylation domain-containing protein